MVCVADMDWTNNSLLALIMFIYAVLGMYVFGAKFRFPDGNSRCHFDDLYRAMVTVFQLLTIEDWPGVMYDGVKSTSLIATLYFVTCIVFGNYILCNLFIAILLDSFNEEAKRKVAKAEKEKAQEAARARKAHMIALEEQRQKNAPPTDIEEENVRRHAWMCACELFRLGV